jgi:hypothetical protein
VLRELGARAHQLRATVRGADHFSARDAAADRDTGSWLMSSAVGLAADLATDIDGLARSLKEGPPDAALAQAVAALRVRVYQLHASARAADHFLDQDNREDHETGSWLIAAALGLATRLASELDDCAAPARRRAAETDPATEPQRRVAATPLRGAA